jgi:hypothetical protein
MRYFYFFIISLLISESAFAQCINGNCKNGLGTFEKTNGDKYIGEFKNGKRYGQGTYYFSDEEVKKGIWENQKLIQLNSI